MFLTPVFQIPVNITNTINIMLVITYYALPHPSKHTYIVTVSKRNQLFEKEKLRNVHDQGCSVQGYNSYLCTYGLYSPVHNVLDTCISITRASGRGLGPGYQ
jgi:hypothetical protein